MFSFPFKRLLLLAMIISISGICFPAFAGVHEELAKLEASSGGRLGISAINTENNTRIQYRANERFPMGCTSKVIGVAAILKKSMTSSHFLQEKVIYQKKDILA